MDFQTAVKILAGKIVDETVYTKMVKVVSGKPAREVEFTTREMAIKAIADETGADGDWIANGNWTGNETAEQIQAEWDTLDVE